MHLYGIEQDGNEIPVPSSLQDIVCGAGEFCLIADVNMSVYRKRRQNKYVNRVVTLPDWLNEEAKRSKINVSQLLQEALKTQLGT